MNSIKGYSKFKQISENRYSEPTFKENNFRLENKNITKD